MKTKFKIIIFVLFLMMIFNYVWYSAILDKADQSYLANNGLLDLSQWDEQKSIVELRGEWLYYDDQLKDELNTEFKTSQTAELKIIPEYKKGVAQSDYYRYGTYSLVVKGLKPHTAYGIYSREQVTAYRLSINDIIILSTGTVGRNKDESRPEWKERSSTVYSDANGQMILDMEISNFEYDDGIFWNAPIIGEAESIFSYHANQLIAEILLIVGFLVITLLFVVLYLYFNQDINLFYFSQFTGVIAIRLMFTSSRPIVYFYDKIDWNIVVRIEYLSGYLLAPTILLFIATLIGGKYLPFIKRFAQGTIVLFTGVTLLTSHKFYSQFLNLYLIGAIILIISSIVGILIFNRKNKLYEIILIMSFSNFLIALFKQLYGNLTSWAPIAVFNAVIGLSMILLHSFWVYIKEKELLAVNAAVDQLTGVYNRHYLKEYGKYRFLEKTGKSANYVLFLDIDGFKKINDVYGHDYGDKVLQIIGKRIQHSLRNDDVIFRYGGDEFVVITQSDTFKQIEIISQRLIQSINESMYHNEMKFNVGVSIGIAYCDRESDVQLEDYIRMSDTAMYKAKQQGGNCFALYRMV